MALKYVPAFTVVDSNENTLDIRIQKHSGTHEREVYIHTIFRGTVHTLRHPLSDIIDF